MKFSFHKSHTFRDSLSSISYKKKLAAFFCVGYAFLLLPLLQIARYDVPSADDYQSFILRATIQENGSNPIQWICALWEYMLEHYSSWQGTFATYLVAPLLSIRWYGIAPIILIMIFSAGIYFLLKSILYRFFEMPKENVIILFVIVSTVCIEAMPSVVEGFYWWSGAVMYVGFFTLAMFTLSLFFWLLPQKMELRRGIYYLFVVFLFFFIGGGNFPTALTTSIILAFVLFYCFFEKRTSVPITIMALAASISGLMLGALSPGNMIRLSQSDITYEPTVIRTIYLAFLLGFQFFRTYFTAFTALALVLALPVIYNGLKNTKRQFRWPLFFALCTFCTYCALFAPTTYSYGWIGPPRYMNIVYFGFVLLVFANEVYFVGWLCAQINSSGIRQKDVWKNMEKGLIKTAKKSTVWIILAAICIAWGITRQNFYVTDTVTYRIPYATESAWLSLKNGQAQEYYSWYLYREQRLEDPSTDVLLFDAYPEYMKPNVLYFADITDDPNEWRNNLVARYYHKTSVALIPAQTLEEETQ